MADNANSTLLLSFKLEPKSPWALHSRGRTGWTDRTPNKYAGNSFLIYEKKRGITNGKLQSHCQKPKCPSLSIQGNHSMK